VVVACPFCFFQFDAGQKEILKNYREKYEIPILTFTDLIGLAMGLPRKKLGLSSHRVKLKKFLQKFDELNGIEL
ncbi:MAG: CoB--CoM heterodisulfide reductase subunit B, partial [Candidatus Helarchaeota archaeon]